MTSMKSSILTVVRVIPSLAVATVDDEIRTHACVWKDGMTVKCRIPQAYYNFTHDWQGGDINTLEMSTLIRYADHFHRYLALSRIDQVEIFELKSNQNSSHPGECRPMGNNLNTNNNIDMEVDAETTCKYAWHQDHK